MKEMCTVLTPYKCEKCRQEMIFFTTNGNILIDYKKLFEKQMTKDQIREFLAKKGVKYIKCIGCNSLYIIDWTKGFPYQLMDKSLLDKFGV